MEIICVNGKCFVLFSNYIDFFFYLMPILSVFSLSYLIQCIISSRIAINVFRLCLEIEAKYEKKMRSLREELELRRKTEIHEIEEVLYKFS